MLFWFCVLLSSITQFPLFPGQNFVYQTNWRPQNKGSSPPRVCLCKQTAMSSPIFPGTEPWKHRSHHSFFLSSKPKCLSSCFASEISLSLLVSIFMKWVVFYEFIDSGGGLTRPRSVQYRTDVWLCCHCPTVSFPPTHTFTCTHARTHKHTHAYPPTKNTHCMNIHTCYMHPYHTHSHTQTYISPTRHTSGLNGCGWLKRQIFMITCYERSIIFTLSVVSVSFKYNQSKDSIQVKSKTLVSILECFIGL